MGRMTGKVAFITGGARGQGRAHALRLAEEGADIAVADICEQLDVVPYPMSTPEDLAETARLVEELDRKCLSFKADARDTQQMRDAMAATAAEFGKLDTIVISHGIGVPHTVDQDDADEVFDATIAANLTSLWRVARASLPHLRAAGGGSITMIASGAALSNVFGLPGYVTSKHGVVGLVKSLAAELSAEWIRVNAVAPTNVATPMLLNDYLKNMFTGDPNSTFDDMVFPCTAINLLPIPWVEADDVARTVLFLASDDAKYITGVTLPVDAGMTVQPPGITPFVGERLAALAAAAGPQS